MAKITVLGLGPGHAGLITRESWAMMESAQHLILRTKIHPTVAALDEAGIKYTTYDGYYEEAADFETLYRSIAEDLLKNAPKCTYLHPNVPTLNGGHRQRIRGARRPWQSSMCSSKSLMVWVMADSNCRPPPCKGGALNQLS